jgi:hypothetical protein
MPLVYSAFIKELQSRSYTIAHPSLPTCTQPKSPHFPIYLLNRGRTRHSSRPNPPHRNLPKTVLVLMHSYGGLVSSEAIPESLTLSHRHSRGQGLKGSAVHLIFFPAFLPSARRPNHSLNPNLRGKSPSPNNNDTHADGGFHILNNAKILYNE